VFIFGLQKYKEKLTRQKNKLASKGYLGFGVNKTEGFIDDKSEGFIGHKTEGFV
jgi:hypothetical protein